MSVTNALLLTVSVLLFVYLWVALFKPDWF
jgi:K+-transporting ATPase KdpF subunit